MKNDIIKFSIILGIITLIASSILGFTNFYTKPHIANKQLDMENELKQNIFSEADRFENHIIQEDEYIIGVEKAYRGNDLLGYLITSKTKGYNGYFNVTTGIKVSGELIKIDISSINETPGLGAKAVESNFKEQFIGDIKTIFNVVKFKEDDNNSDIQSISGATITTKAVVDAVNRSIDFFNKNLSGR